ncbi:MAG: spore coat protein [Candidatus Levybacteria bacterium RIFCSPHIGHO2_12_FULL_38_12]|nr:MAG: spore coat protein [Candidatus Levybacteria bacterium RIFCSPHIGHO2_01_FULL_38_12]OGH21890.1 MAG: spore coat protein [Candidatus Levybacteria bacterium RIFCSPHIGHO2_02_FULL_37_18]OGH22822.1 MAG: spore coat protein [Candidatus Levybacteria bacterium RIFCSPHIGHO2_12_FULL_38_12]OGH33547.1 MAG: spore coat protein [Candidatus Levybacteria bacterium RIFCSPLOWO2_01_FULL_37_20]OGH44468.1 MAG: spore coat protein [Candidatus Levybacteria bacterium RIFCSPLOWO2_02_FULL_37_18]
MKGIILAGGLATRLRPLTWVTNKHLLPIYNKPMIYYPLEALVGAGITDILITSSEDHAGHFENLLKSGSGFGVRIFYAIQKNPKGGIADAILLSEEFAKGEKIVVILGDNIFRFNLKQSVERFNQQEKGAMIFGVRMPTDFGQYGVIEMDESRKVLSIEEKPQHPKSDIVQTGIYMYDNRVFDFIRLLTPSGRGELEVTDLNNAYVAEKTLQCELLDWWIDAGTSFDELLRANNLVAEKVKKGEL